MTDDDLLERIAIEICARRMMNLGDGIVLDDTPEFRAAVMQVWNREGEINERQRARYRGDAAAALAIIRAQVQTTEVHQGIDPRASCQANRSGAAEECKRCGRKMGEGCGESGPYADPAIADALGS